MILFFLLFGGFGPFGLGMIDDLEPLLNRARLFIGTKTTVLERLAAMIDATKADEVMVTTMIYDHGARRRSYELLAEAFGLDAGKK